MEQRKCDLCDKPAVWRILVMFGMYYRFRCKEHQWLAAREYGYDVWYKGKWVNIGSYEDATDWWDKCVGEAKLEGLKKNSIPPEEYIEV